MSQISSYVLGFDVAKAKLDYSLVNGAGVEQLHGTVVNEAALVAALILGVQGCYVDEQHELTAVVEATGCYHYPLIEAAAALKLPCRTYNPLITKGGIKSSVRGKKTDRTDALLIARMGLRGEGRLHTPEPYVTTKHYARSCQKLSVLGSSFKQYKTHISELLDGELTPEALEVLANIQKAITEARTQMYKDLAASAKGDIFTRLQTIPGVGPYIASSLIGEIQDISRFKTAHCLTAYAGLDPRVRQSGHSLNSTGRLTKRGSSHLRRSIFIAASVARRYDPCFKTLYDRKRAEGKPYTVAVVVVARKLLSVVRAIWLSEQDYDVSQWPEANKTEKNEQN
jgi:transposase